MLGFVRGTLRHVFRALLYGFAGGLLVVIAGLVVYLDGREDLSVWHTADLDEEFSADSDVDSFDDYLALEDRLFAQLDERVYAKIEDKDRRKINRFNRGSLSDPTSFEPNWNRSFQLQVDEPRLGVLLIHGLSDSPYSLRSFGEQLQDAGAWVVGLRVPGHGTAPSGLTDVTWRDMAAAVRIAAAHVRQKAPGRPVLIIGYSNGGALAVEYALAAIRDDALVPPDQLVLLSPEIGIANIAALAAWQERLGHLFGLEKLAWNSLLPEYDPYKYGSFAVNAGKQAYEITQEIASRINELGAAGELGGFPPMLAFQSVADATISAPDLVTKLVDPLPVGAHELVLFDINRAAEIEPILKHDPAFWLDSIMAGATSGFAVSLLTNANDQSHDIVLLHRKAGQDEITEVPLGMRWPRQIYSLAHVALPFPPDDPIYGRDQPRADEARIHLGMIALRGERGVLAIGASDMLRLRWNPFHAYIESRVLGIAAELAAADDH